MVLRRQIPLVFVTEIGPNPVNQQAIFFLISCYKAVAIDITLIDIKETLSIVIVGK